MACNRTFYVYACEWALSNYVSSNPSSKESACRFSWSLKYLNQDWSIRTNSKKRCDDGSCCFQDDVFVWLQGSLRVASASGILQSDAPISILQIPEPFRPSVAHRFVATTAPLDTHSRFHARKILLEIDTLGVLKVNWDLSSFFIGKRFSGGERDGPRAHSRHIGEPWRYPVHLVRDQRSRRFYTKLSITSQIFCAQFFIYYFRSNF